MKACLLGLLLGGGFASILSAAEPAPDDAFLSQSITCPPANENFVYLEQLQPIEAVIGRKVIFPPGLIDYLTREKLTMSLLFTPGPDKSGRITVQDYLNQRGMVVGMKWKYDPAQEAVVMDFAWHREPAPGTDIRALVELVDKGFPIPWRDRTSGTDPWESALDALLSQPENFPHAWKVRLQDICTGGTVGFYPEVYTCLLPDASGKEHLLVLHRREPLIIPGPAPSIIYYLLDEKGRWEDGGVFGCGYTTALSEIHFDPSQHRITLTHVAKKHTSCSFELGLPGGILSFHRYGDMGLGTPSLEYEPTRKELRLILTAHTQDTYLYHLSVEHGKLVSALWKNGTLLAPAQYEQAITPLQPLGD